MCLWYPFGKHLVKANCWQYQENSKSPPAVFQNGTAARNLKWGFLGVLASLESTMVIICKSRYYWQYNWHLMLPFNNNILIFDVIVCHPMVVNIFHRLDHLAIRIRFSIFHISFG